MIRDFGSFTRRGLLADLERPAEIWEGGHITDKAGEGGETGEETVEDRKTTDLPAETRGRKKDPKCLGFHSVKPGKVRGGSTSPKGRAVLHQTVDESFVCGKAFTGTHFADLGRITG